ncbi:MAG TPA: ribosome silencing factor [Vicinamibacterales bacterium]
MTSQPGRDPAAERRTAGRKASDHTGSTSLDDYPREIQETVAATLAKKAEHVVVLDLRHTQAFTDFFVVCSGTNARQVKAIVDSVEETLWKVCRQKPISIEGYGDSEWVLLDYFDFVVHVFTPETREFYALERLWGSALRAEFDQARLPARAER